MKKYLKYIFVVFVTMLVSNSVWADIASKGEWTATTISSDRTINLDGNVTVKGIISITGGTLTINANGAARTIKAGTSIAQIFYVSGAGKLVIKGESNSKRVIIDGGAVFNSAGINNSKGHPFDTTAYKPFHDLTDFPETNVGETDTYKDPENSGWRVNEAIQVNNGSLHLEYVTIQNVHGHDSNTAGGIYVTGENTGETRKTMVKNCIIQYCASKSGAAMHVNLGNVKGGHSADPEKCRVDVIDTKFRYCYSWGDKGDEGGTLRTNGGCVCNIYLTRVTIENNYSHGAAGAVYWNGGGHANTCLYFNGCTIRNNVALTRGGAMMLETSYRFVPDGAVTTISNNRVRNADGYGGAIVVTSYGGGVLTEASDHQYTFNYDLTDKVQITGNTAGEGGGIAFRFQDYKLNDDWNNNNNSNYQVTTNINFNGAVISNNTATSGVGGGVRLYNNTANGNLGNRKAFINVYLNHGTFGQNTAKTYGGAIYTYHADIKNNSTSDNVLTISSNTATGGDGGAIYVDGGTSIRLASTSITGNKAQNGGAMAISAESGSNLTISLGTSTISNNSATVNGGAIYLPAGSLTVTGTSQMQGNTAGANGGVAYVNNGTVTLGGATTMSGNKATSGSGGVFYVQKGSGYTGSVGVTTVAGEMKSNVAGTNGGVFYVNGGSITLNGATTMTQNSAANGGAIALQGGTFTIHNDSSINNNTATGNGGGLWVNNPGAALTCVGGSFVNNTANGNGGGLYANGSKEFTFAANLQYNKAQNGAGIYVDGGMALKFGQANLANGLIVGNIAAPVNGGTGSASAGVGGGIYLKKGSLEFMNTQNLGVYNNSASYSAADIYASGSSTSIKVPYVKNMNLTGFDVPGNELYWVYDKPGNRYEDSLLDMSKNIPDKVQFSAADIANKYTTITAETWLDLGYDLVFVTVTPIGLDDIDTAFFVISYPHLENGATVLRPYREVAVSGKYPTIVGLPSGDWVFATNDWNYMYEDPSLVYKDSNNNVKQLTDGYAKVTRDLITAVEATFVPKPGSNVYHNAKVVNKMKP